MVTGLQNNFARLPGAARGILWMLGAGLCYAVIYALIRYLTQRVPIPELIFLRAVVSLTLMAPWLARSGIGALRTRQAPFYVLRVIFAFSAMLTWVYGLKHLPLEDATALNFTLPIFTVILAVLFMGEQVGLHRWAAILVGFVGVLIIIRPGIVALSLPAFSVLASSILFASNNILTKHLTKRDPIPTVVFYMFLSVLIVSSVPTAFMWETPLWSDVPWIILLGILGFGAQQCITRALAAADHSVVMPFSFVRLPLVSLVAFIVFAELPDLWTWIGATVIFGSTYYIARREALGGGAAKMAGGGA